MRVIITLLVIFGIIALAVEKIKDLVKGSRLISRIQGRNIPETVVHPPETPQCGPYREGSSAARTESGDCFEFHEADNNPRPLSDMLREAYAAEIQCDGCGKVFILIQGKDHPMHHVVVYNNNTRQKRNMYLCDECYINYFKMNNKDNY